MKTRSHAFPVGDRETHIVVDFFVPGITLERAPEIFGFYKNLYTRLYDEDVGMMSGRQAQLDAIKNRAPAGSPSPRVLGSLDEVRSRLPIIIKERGRKFRIVELEGKLLAHAPVCPHTRRPLGDAAISNESSNAHDTDFDSTSSPASA